MDGLMIISNASPGDVTFDSDRGSWNISRAREDCEAGLHGTPYAHDMAGVIDANERVDVDELKIASMVANVELLAQAPPLIFVEEGEIDGRPIIWLIDGHHRVRALHRLGVPRCVGWVIAESKSRPYRIYYNGDRVAPWLRQKARRIK